MNHFKPMLLAGACLIIAAGSAESAFSMSRWNPSWTQGSGQNGGTPSEYSNNGPKPVVNAFEPSTALVVGSGIAGIALLRRMRSRQK